ncbi:MAG TPA: class I SAM-dependent methyltransferase [Candidatus Dormibacteraeota bacterium]|nr:class I SAM-dependent methyltransferase [Candidatus Dormibacteraeota bacterium]
MADSDAARVANTASYATRDVLHGSPHLNHASVWTIYERMVRKALGAVRAKPRVLDLGAGDGTASRLWVEAGASLTAVDTSPEQLRLLKARHPSAVTVEGDAIEFLQQQVGRFDVVSHVSMLHHIPDYLALLRASAGAVAQGGALLTFQDPLRYDCLPPGHYVAAQALYIPWRLSEGRVLEGIGNRIRRTRGIFLEDNLDDQGEYHFHRNGVDSDAILAQLRPDFASTAIEIYFSSHARLAQWLGERMRVRSTFGILATGRR